MKDDKKFNISPLRMIRIVKELRTKEMAETFGVVSPYINLIENGQRSFSTPTLEYGLDNLGISMADYEALEKFSQTLLGLDTTKQNRFKIMLLETTAIVDSTPEERKQIEDTVEFLIKSCQNKVK